MGDEGRVRGVEGGLKADGVIEGALNGESVGEDFGRGGRVRRGAIGGGGGWFLLGGWLGNRLGFGGSGGGGWTEGGGVGGGVFRLRGRVGEG